jgi:hypothetical protein
VPASARARQCTGLFRPRVSSIERDHRELSRFGWRASFAGRRIGRCTCSSMARKLRLDLWPPAVRVRLRGRVRSYDFCKCVFSRARPRTARTSRPRGRWLGRLLVSSRKFPFDSRANRRGFSRSGAEITESRHSPLRLLTMRTSPQPQSLRAPLVASNALFRVWSDAGRKR